MKLTQWQNYKLQDALDNCKAIINKAHGKKAACACTQEACKELEVYIETWIMPPIEQVLENKK